MSWRDNDPKTLARQRYPHRLGAQAHFVRGYLAELGDEAARRWLVGSYAEQDGALCAQAHQVAA